VGRPFEAGAVVHVFARGNNKQRIFFGDEDRRLYLVLLGHVVTRQRWFCLAYCLMHNHVHLLLETPAPNLGTGMQRLHGLYGQAFNRRHGRCGHVFQGRFGSNRIQTSEHLLTTIRYIALNPVAAGFCGSALDWPWSSHTAALQGDAPPWLAMQRLLTYFDEWGGEPAARHEAFVR
jgi:putative transposase